MAKRVKAYVRTLGCDKNTVDSEVIVSLLGRAGFEPVEDPEAAELIVVNTCCFIQPAKEESLDNILDLVRMKQDGNCQALVVAGCLAERYAAELRQVIPEIDGFVGPAHLRYIAEASTQALRGETPCLLGPAPQTDGEPLPRERRPRGATAFLKIADGCNHLCNFCIIPRVRGPYRSRTMESIVEESLGLARLGVLELVLVAQDTTSYGQDTYGRLALPELLRKLDVIQELKWIRLLYAYPSKVTSGLVETLASLQRVVPYLDLPLQSGSDRILRKMDRPERREKILELVDWLRRTIPDLVLRSSFIVGYPGESETDFEETLSLLREIRFDYAGFFIYSPEEGTPAALLPDNLPAEEKVERYNLAVRTQGEVSQDRSTRWLGRQLEVLLEQRGEDGAWIGRFFGQAPEVDGRTYCYPRQEKEPFPGLQAGEKLKSGTDVREASGLPLRPGSFIRVRVEHVEGGDLIGTMV